MEVVLIAAVAANGVIGRDGEIPWFYPEDLKHFKRETVGHPVIMGRTTYRSIVERNGEPLPDRYSIVLSHDDIDVPDRVYNAHGIDEAIEEAAGKGEERAYVIGGASVYEQFLERSLVDRMVLTEIKESYEGDTYFPSWEQDGWMEVEREEHDAFDFVEYVRR